MKISVTPKIIFSGVKFLVKIWEAFSQLHGRFIDWVYSQNSSGMQITLKKKQK